MGLFDGKLSLLLPAAAWIGPIVCVFHGVSNVVTGSLSWLSQPGQASGGPEQMHRLEQGVGHFLPTLTGLASHCQSTPTQSIPNTPSVEHTVHHKNALPSGKDLTKHWVIGSRPAVPGMSEELALQDAWQRLPVVFHSSLLGHEWVGAPASHGRLDVRVFLLIWIASVSFCSASLCAQRKSLMQHYWDPRSWLGGLVNLCHLASSTGGLAGQGLMIF